MSRREGTRAEEPMGTRLGRRVPWTLVGTVALVGLGLIEQDLVWKGTLEKALGRAMWISWATNPFFLAALGPALATWFAVLGASSSAAASALDVCDDCGGRVAKHQQCSRCRTASEVVSALVYLGSGLRVLLVGGGLLTNFKGF